MIPPVRRPGSPRCALLACLLLSAAGCASGGVGDDGSVATAGGVARVVAPGLEVRPLAPGVWLHTTWRDLPGTGPFPSHGLVVEDGDGLLLVDSAWGEQETVLLVGWIERALGRPVTRMLSTHHHDDRLSGSGFLQARDTPVLAHPLTPALAAEDGLTPPAPLGGLDEPGATLALGPVEVFYPGPGHAVDNLMVWIPGPAILFGGCAVRPGGSGSLGNTEDADMEGWATAIARTRARYPAARLVVPGHGPAGGPDLLTHTLALLDAGGTR